MSHLQDLKNEKLFIKEMFPDLSDEEVDNLFISSKDINIIITKILDGTHKGLNINLKDMTLNKMTQKPISKDLYYPELFMNRGIDATSGDIDRSKSDLIYNKIKQIKNKLNLCKDKKVMTYEAEEKHLAYLELEKLNKKRALMLLNRSLQKPELIDLHGMYTKEALMFVSDFIKVYNPKEINLITGCGGNSQSLRPSVINFLREKGFKVTDNDSPYIKGVKKNCKG